MYIQSHLPVSQTKVEWSSESGYKIVISIVPVQGICIIQLTLLAFSQNYFDWYHDTFFRLRLFVGTV